MGLASKDIPMNPLPTLTSLGLMLIGLIVVFTDGSERGKQDRQVASGRVTPGEVMTEEEEEGSAAKLCWQQCGWAPKGPNAKAQGNPLGNDLAVGPDDVPGRESSLVEPHSRLHTFSHRFIVLPFRQTDSLLCRLHGLGKLSRLA